MNSSKINWLRVSISLLLVVLLIAAYWWIQSKTNYFASGWPNIVLGAILLVLGSFVLASSGWSLLGPISKIGRKVTCLIFAIAIAIGGTLTTRGWKQLDNHEHRKALITAVYREWELNTANLNGMDVFLLNDEKLGEPRFLPRMRTSAMSLAYTSNLFDDRDKKLLEAIFNYENGATAFNTYLASIDYRTTYNISKEQRVRNFNAVKKSNIFKSFRGKHEKMKEVLEKYESSITGIDWSK